eukprot:15454651-Alexandrium_andersonii.AAC.1
MAECRRQMIRGCKCVPPYSRAYRHGSILQSLRDGARAAAPMQMPQQQQHEVAHGANMDERADAALGYRARCHVCGSAFLYPAKPTRGLR